VKQIRKRFTYANVMSSIAVFLVLGGATAIAAGLAKNSVGTKQLKKNAVTTKKIKNGAVTGAKVKAGSLTASNFAPGQLPAGPQGPVGPTFGAFGEGGCDSLGTGLETCASTGSINLPTSGHVLLVASAEWDNDEDAAPNSGDCRLSVDGNQVGPDVTFGENTETHTIGEGGSVALNTVTGPVSAGGHTFSLDCSENQADVFIEEAMISAVLLGG
jgi:hypothetical protein